MTTAYRHVWAQIEALLQGAQRSVALIAPFIKKSVFEAAITAVPHSVDRIDCVTRWSPAEVAVGVSDPEIMEIAEEDERINIALCPSLHAKIYLADDHCLIGSANLTDKAMGWTPSANIELLIETHTSHREVQRVLHQLETATTLATPHMAVLVRQQADLLQEDHNPLSVRLLGQLTQFWCPVTRRPENLYAFYSGRRRFASAIEAGIMQDLALLDIPAGLSEDEFNLNVQSRLHAIPELRKLLRGESLSNIELQRAIEEREGITEDKARRMTENIAGWLTHFGRYYTEIGSWELRHGRELA